MEPIASRHAKIDVTLHGVTAKVSAAVLASVSQLRNKNTVFGKCSMETTLPPLPQVTGLYYTYSVCHTPYIESLSGGRAVNNGARLRMNGSNLPLPSEAQHVTLTVDGIPCEAGSTSSSRSKPPPNVSSPNETVLTGGTGIHCNMPRLPAGYYRLQLHVAGLGWGFANADTDKLYVAPVIHSAQETPLGSSHGGTQLIVSGSGFGSLSSADNQVLIGNTPCDVTSVTLAANSTSLDMLTCITRKQLDDGYSSIVKLAEPLGYWRFSPVQGSLPNLGSLGSSVSATTQSPWSGRPGLPISGIHNPNTAAFFNGTYVSVPFSSKLHPSSGFGIALWVKVDSESVFGHYRQIIGSSEPGEISRGFSLWITPCGEIELWLATGISQTDQTADNSTILCDPIAFLSNGSSYGSSSSSSSYDSSTASNEMDYAEECVAMPMPCEGIRLVTRNPLVSQAGGDISQLPTGVWSVHSHPARDLTNWTFITFGFKRVEKVGVDPLCPDLKECHGSFSLSIDGAQVAKAPSRYLPPLASPLEIGGSSRVSYGTPLIKRTTLPYAGEVAEVSVYEQPLSSINSNQQYQYATTQENAIHLYVNGDDRTGTGITPEVRQRIS